MIWIFARGSDVLHLETRFDDARAEYVLVVVWADPQMGSPTILADGWRIT
jgi:hypothetical protein